MTGHTETAIGSKQTLLKRCSVQWTQEGAVDSDSSELTVQVTAAAVSGDS